MPNKANAKVPIILDKPRHLLYDLNALAAFEEATGKSFLGGMSLEALTTKDLRALIWAGLLHEEPELTLQYVGSIVHAGNLADIDRQIGIAMGLAMPDAKEGAGDTDRPSIMK